MKTIVFAALGLAIGGSAGRAGEVAALPRSENSDQDCWAALQAVKKYADSGIEHREQAEKSGQDCWASRQAVKNSSVRQNS